MKVLVLDYPEAAESLRQEGFEVVEVDGVGEDALQDAGVRDADAFVVRGGGYSVQIPVARHVNPELRTVLVADDVPDYVRGTADLILSLEVGAPDVVVDALI